MEETHEEIGAKNSETGKKENHRFSAGRILVLALIWPVLLCRG